MRTFFTPFLALATILSWAIWQVPQLRSADSPPKLPLEVPLQTGDGMPTLEVMINGQGPFLFGFDVQIKDVIKLGRHEFSDATIVYPALGDMANVGFNLSQFVITFDQKNERVRFSR